MRAFVQKQNQPQQTLSSQSQSYDVQARSRFNITSTLAHDFSRIPVQPKLAVSSPADTYEQEADRLSEQVMNMSGSESMDTGERGCSKCQTTQSRQEHQPMRREGAGSN